MSYRPVALVLCLLGLAILGQAVDLRQEDFEFGTVRLTEPGTYRLVEDIIFNPNSVQQLGVDSYNAGDVQPSQFTFAGGEYDPAAYGIGFFAAVAISGDSITFDLNGHTMTQSKEHALQQRFFAHIELADQPFIPAQGPHNFGDSLGIASNVVIKNGRLGRSSHHGIHGNGAVNVTIKDLVIEDFEIAGIALNGVQGATIRDVIIQDSRTDVPVLGTFSAGRFIRRYVNYLASSGSTTTLTVGGQELTASQIRSNLVDSLNNAFEDIVEGDGIIDAQAHPDEFNLYHNPPLIVDGSVYGLLLNQLGIAVNGFPDNDVANPAERVLIQDVTLRNLASAPHEIIGLQVAPGGIAALDPVGAMIQFRNIAPNGQPVTLSSLDESVGVYVGNAVANAQILVAKAAANGDFDGSGIDTSRTNLPSEAIAFAEGNLSFEDLLEDFPWVCNGDSMFHVMKGVIGFKLDASDQVTVNNVKVERMSNLGAIGSDVCDYTPTTFSNPLATVPGYEGAIIRAASVSGSFDVHVNNFEVDDLLSASGTAIGFDVLTDSHSISCQDCFIDNVTAGEDQVPSDYDNNPTELPQAIGFRVGSDARDVNIDQFTIGRLESIGTTDDIQVFGQDVFYSEASASSGSSRSSSSGSGSGSGSSSSSAPHVALPFAAFVAAAIAALA